MEDKGKVRFIRVRGKVVPIKTKPGDKNMDGANLAVKQSERVGKKYRPKKAERTKQRVFNFVGGAAGAGVAGKLFVKNISKSKIALIAGLGGLVGGALNPDTEIKRKVADEALTEIGNKGFKRKRNKRK